MKGYNTNLASEFYVLSQLYRKGFEASLTLGNKKSVDIIIFNNENKLITIDVKGMIGTTLFPLDNVDTEKEDPYHYLVFVSYKNKFYDEKSVPLTYIVPLGEISSLLYQNPKGNRKGVRLTTLKKASEIFENNWEIIGSYGSGYIKNKNLNKKKWFEFLRIYNGLKENFLPFEYFSKTILIKEFYEIWFSVKKFYPLNIEKVINDYCSYIDINEVNRLKNDIINTFDKNQVNEIIAILDIVISQKQDCGEAIWTKGNSAQELGEPLPKVVLEGMIKQKEYMKKYKDELNKKLKQGI